MTEKEKTIFFNEHYPVILNEVEKRRRKWQLKGVPSVDFDDIKQILMRHVYVKLHLYDNSRPFVNWLNTLLSNQIHNALRNLFYNHSRPCLKCACSLPDNGCELFSEQTEKCPLFKIWTKTKRDANNIRLSLPMENHQQEVYDLPSQECDYEKAEKILHAEMEKSLKKHEWVVYQLIYIEHLTDLQVAKKMKWVSGEGRKPGYGNIARLKKIFIEKARKIKEEIDLF